MPSEKLRKVTVNLYDEDIKYFEERFGYGWSVELRRIMNREVTNYQLRDCGYQLPQPKPEPEGHMFECPNCGADLAIDLHVEGCERNDP